MSRERWFWCIVLVCSVLLPGAIGEGNLSVLIETDLKLRNVSLCHEYECRYKQKGPRVLPTWEEQGCFCDDECIRYSDCCHNSHAINRKQEEDVKMYQDSSCRLMRNYQGFYVIAHCPIDYNGSDDVRRLCHNSQKLLDNSLFGNRTRPEQIFDVSDDEGLMIEDPLLVLPVTSRQRRVTFNNVYCALCHGLQPSELEIWSSRVECPQAPKQAKDYVVSTYSGAWELGREEESDYDSENNTALIGSPQPEFKSDGSFAGWFISYDQQRYQCRIDPYFPETLETVTRRCRKTVRQCPADYSGDFEVERLCQMYTGFVYDFNDVAYHNPHCALCHGVQPYDMLCSLLPIRSRWKSRNAFNNLAFSMILDFGGSGRVGQRSPTHLCFANQIWDPFKNVCRDLLCNKEAGYTITGGQCKSNVSTTAPDSPTKNESSLEEVTVDEFLSCAKVVLDEDSFVVMNNETVIVPLYEGLVLHTGQYRLLNGSGMNSSDNHTDVHLLICAPDLDISAKFDTALGYLTVICLLVSIISLCLHLSVFCAMSELQNLSGRNLASLSVCLLTAYVGFLLSSAVSGDPASCRALAVINYTAYLLSFCWMNVMALDVFLTLRYATRELRVSSGRQRGRYLLYCSYVLSITLLLVTLTLLADGGLLPSASGHVAPGFGAQFGVCWMKNKQALKYFFAVPLFIILSINVLLFVLTTRIIRHTRSATASHTCSASLMNFRLCWRLSLMMGLSWVINLLNGWLDKQYLHYVGAILTALQGLFIFVSFTLNDKVRVKLSSRLRIYSRLLSWSRDSADQQRQRASTTVTSLTTSHSAPPTAEKNSHSAQSAGANSHQSRALGTEALNISAVTPL